MSTYFTFLSAVYHYTIIKKINETSHDRMFCKQKMVNGRVRGNNITPGGIRCMMAYCQGINIVLYLRYRKFLQRSFEKTSFIKIYFNLLCIVNWTTKWCIYLLIILYKTLKNSSLQNYSHSTMEKSLSLLVYLAHFLETNGK